MIENFKEEQKFHNEKIEDMLSKIEKSRKYQETEKEKYKKKIQILSNKQLDPRKKNGPLGPSGWRSPPSVLRSVCEHSGKTQSK